MTAPIPHLLPPEVVKRSVWEDRYERRVNNWITPWDFREPIDVGIVNKQYALGEGLTIYTARQVRTLGMERVIGEALARAGDGADAIYCTVDIDVLTFPYGIGTGASSPEGLMPYELLDAMFWLGQDLRVAAFDLVEIDPTRDVAGMTAKTGATVLLTFLGGLSTRLRPAGAPAQ